MTKSAFPDKMEIAPGYTVADWLSLRPKLDQNDPSTPEWDEALKIFDARIRRRFLDPVDVLILADEKRASGNQGRQTFGFAVLAIDFLVIETIQGFREGLPDHRGQSKALITKFLMQWDEFKNCLPNPEDSKMLAKRIYYDYRCALHHKGSTEGDLRVGVSEKTFQFKGENEIKINRTSLHNKLKLAFDAYLDALRAPEEKELRANFLKKMDAICGIKA